MKFFSDQARAAAIAALRKRREQQKAPGEFEVFIVRSSVRYAWELRRFGGVLIARSDGEFDTIAAARAAGLAKLQSLEASDVSVTDRPGSPPTGRLR